jgi:hypothetical protein
MCIQPDFEARPPFGGPAAGDASLQVVIELLRDQTLFEQGLVSPHLLPQRGLTQKSDFKSRHIIGVLSAKGVQGIAHVFASMLDDFTGDLDQPLVKYPSQTRAVEADKPVDQKARHQQEFDAVGEPIRKKALDSEIPIDKIGDTEQGRKGNRLFCRALVPEPAFGARSLDESIRVAQQDLDGWRRGDLVGAGFENQHTLLVT